MFLITFTVLGGDLRSVYLCRRLLADGHRVRSFGLELSELPQSCRCDSLADALQNTGCVILPIPTADGILLRSPYSCAPILLEDVAAAIPDGIPVFGSGKCSFPMTDLTADPVMAVKNAALTAQGALLLILQNTDRSLTEQKILILGAGRIGTLLALRLKALGAEVTVTSRNPVRRAQCAAMGLKAIHTNTPPTADVIVNTVPHPVLDSSALGRFPHGSLLLELASLPGGFDPTEAEQVGLRVVIGRGLPGKLTPAGAADIIAETVYKELRL